MKAAVIALALAVALPPAVAAQDTIPLAVGAMAPDFSLPAATQAGVDSAPLRLTDLRDQTVVIAFFYKARTKG
jgi:thioredoxin-dependent peroxiredoxin